MRTSVVTLKLLRKYDTDGGEVAESVKLFK